MADEKILGVVSGTRDGKLLVVTTPTRCDDPTTGEVYMGLVSGTRNGKPLVAISTQRCDPDDELTDGQTYLGLVSGTRNGKPLLAVPCGNCDGGGGDGEITDCFDCTRPEVINISIVRAYPGNDCPFDDTQDATMTYETRTVSTYTMDPDLYPCPDPEDCTEIDCFDSENSEHPCCLPCAEYCEVTRTGYWSDVITYTFGYCYFGDPDCAPLRKAVMTCRYLLACDKDDTWRLEIVWLTSQFCCREPEDTLLPQTDSVVCPGTEFPAPWWGYALSGPCITGIFHILAEPSIPCNEDGNDINFNLTHYFFGEVALDTEITIYE